ncbi:hypothetical protein TWF730_000221 [Orbilia blumenaviensis]|uniref:D-arabinono-1,4-lactone oxidase n=1 Tax=Orbilia blumenaviensis TaxID=1796055 RepID=A0AAV9VM84_9PEZI
MPSEKTTLELLSTLAKEPSNESHLAELKKRIAAGDEKLDHAFFSTMAELAPPQITSAISGGWFGPKTWTNCVNQQKCYPTEIRTARNLKDITTAVNEAHSKGITVRAVGSGHSYSNVAPVYKGGLLLDPHEMNKVLKVDEALLKDSQNAGVLFAVESGITIKDLNLALDKRGLALQNMGAFDGQTLAGAISTGTHGTGINFGPIASSVRAIVLVSGDGTVYQIEKSEGISDPEKFKEKVHDRTLKQDDDWFNSVVISMGCTGIIYSYILEVVPAYYLTESRELGSWTQAKEHLRMTEDGDLPEVLTKNRHYEIDINPYPVENVHSCIIQTKNIDPTNKPHGSRGIVDWIAGILAGCPLAEHWIVWALNLWPQTTPEMINNALNSLVVKDHADKSYKILNIGAVNNVKAFAVELSYPVDKDLVPEIDRLLGIFHDEAAKMNWYLAGPFSLRFVAASDAYLAPQHGRLTCMVELDMLLGIKAGDELLRSIIKKVQAKNPAVRVHWGLDLDTVDKDEVLKVYPEFSKWLEVYAELNPVGLFNSPFTDRLEISATTKGI